MRTGHGSYYELALELDPSGNDLRVMRTVETLWRQPELRGPWRERTCLDADPDEITIEADQGRLYGCLTVDDRREVGCISCLVRVEGESDWLDLCIPTGMLELRFPVSYPLDRATNPWLSALDDVLVRMASAVYAATSFQLGLIGEEVSGVSSAAEVTAEECERGGLIVPGELWRKLSPHREGELMPTGVVYVPFLGPHISYGG